MTEKMTEISNECYVTINKKCCRPDGFVDRFFVGGKRTLDYRGDGRWYLVFIYTAFKRLQGWNSNICELHILKSKTDVSETCLSGEYGRNVWARLKFSNGNLSKWVFVDDNGGCGGNCLEICAENIKTVYEKICGRKVEVVKQKRLGKSR